jgi:predicted nuclease of predicted toxin-antitoxin system
MNFLIDAQLPPGLAGWLIEKGYTATHVNDISLTAAEDYEIWDYALESGSIILNKSAVRSER